MLTERLPAVAVHRSAFEELHGLSYDEFTVLYHYGVIALRRRVRVSTLDQLAKLLRVKSDLVAGYELYFTEYDGDVHAIARTLISIARISEPTVRVIDDFRD
jgi:hypothetical protein